MTLAARVAGIRAVAGIRGVVRTVAGPASLAGLALLVAASIVALAGLAPPLVIVVAALGATGLHVLAVVSGYHSVLGLAVAWLLVVLALATRSVLAEVGPVVLAGAATVVLVYHELVRLAFAARRRAVIDRSVYVTSALSLAVVGLLGVIAVAIAEPLAEPSTDRSGLWVPAAAATVLVVAAALVVVPGLGGGRSTADRWEPGERLPPWRDEASDGDGIELR